MSIKISSKDDLTEQKHRKITLTGGADGVQIAQYLIQQKVAQSVLELERKSEASRARAADATMVEAE